MEPDCEPAIGVDTTGDANKLIRNEYGVTAGGPFMVPKLYDGRNKSFWFFNYEGFKQRQESAHGQRRTHRCDVGAAT